MEGLQKNPDLTSILGDLHNRPFSAELSRLLKVTEEDLPGAAAAVSEARSVALVSGFPVPPYDVPELDGIPAVLTMHRFLPNSVICGPAAEVLGLPACRGDFDVVVYVEFPGPGRDGLCHTYSGMPFECPKVDVRGSVTIAVGDGGNELGMGKALELAPEELGDIWCVRESNFLIYAPISELGADLLLLAMGYGRGLMEAKTEAFERALRLGLPDGITLVPGHSIDGVPLMEYFGILHDLITLWEK